LLARCLVAVLKYATCRIPQRFGVLFDGLLSIFVSFNLPHKAAILFLQQDH
jgi:hypothetical protein